MSSFGMDDFEPEFTDPADYDGSEFSSPSLDDLEDEFLQDSGITETSADKPEKSSIIWDDTEIKEGSPPPAAEPEPTPEPTPENEPVPEAKNEQNETPNPSSVDTSKVKAEEKAPQIDYGDNTKDTSESAFTEKQKEVFGDFEPPAKQSEPPVYDQKLTDTIPTNTKNFITQAVVIIFVFALLFGMILVFSKGSGRNRDDRNTQIVENSGITEATIGTESPTSETMIQSNKWEPGIIGQTPKATTQATTLPLATTEAVTEAVTTQAQTTEKYTASEEATEEAGKGGVKPTDSRFADTSELTLYIQYSASVIYRKEQELVQDYVDGRTDKNGFLETMGTYSTAMDELSRLLILNRPCYDNDSDTYDTLENSISKGMSYADRSITLANADTPLSDFKNQLEQ